jgi:hypothetical protein
VNGGDAAREAGDGHHDLRRGGEARVVAPDPSEPPIVRRVPTRCRPSATPAGDGQLRASRIRPSACVAAAYTARRWSLQTHDNRRGQAARSGVGCPHRGGTQGPSSWQPAAGSARASPEGPPVASWQGLPAAGHIPVGMPCIRRRAAGTDAGYLNGTAPDNIEPSCVRSLPSPSAASMERSCAVPGAGHGLRSPSCPP